MILETYPMGRMLRIVGCTTSLSEWMEVYGTSKVRDAYLGKVCTTGILRADLLYFS